VIPAAALASLRSALGAEAVREDEQAFVDGAGLTPVLRPPDGDALARALAALAERKLSCVIRGGGSRLALGNPPRGASVLLSTAALAGVDDFDPGEGVCHARAGTPLAAIEREVAAAGWQLPLDPPGDGTTLGGVLATAAQGPRAQGFGRTRDCVLGLEVALADGRRTHCGGRVVKNVTGYDLNKLYVGSLGTLGVIEGAWLRLRPRPQRTETLEAGGLARDAACAAGLAAARRVSARAAALELAPDAGGARLLVELAGDAASVERDALWCAAELGARPAQASALAELRARQGATPGPHGLRFRIAALPSRCAELVSRLARAGAGLIAYPGLGLVYAGFALPEGGEPRRDEVFRQVDLAAAACGGARLLEAGPAWVKRGRDAFGELGGALALVKSVKQRFDPESLLNPGRFAGHL
jgi:glycolate oxidase FAD binding subunit